MTLPSRFRPPWWGFLIFFQSFSRCDLATLLLDFANPDPSSFGSRGGFRLSGWRNGKKKQLAPEWCGKLEIDGCYSSDKNDKEKKGSVLMLDGLSKMFSGKSSSNIRQLFCYRSLRCFFPKKRLVLPKKSSDSLPPKKQLLFFYIPPLGCPKKLVSKVRISGFFHPNKNPTYK